MKKVKLPTGLKEMQTFPFIEVLMGRRSRRFFRGAEIPEGAFAYKSRHKIPPLTELGKLLVLSAMAGNTGWNYLIPYNDHYAPHLLNYASAPESRPFPSGVGFHVGEIFFTDDEGVDVIQTRDAFDLRKVKKNGSLDLQGKLENHRAHLRKLADGTLNLPPRDLHIESHNHWVANRPGSLFIFPVADVALHNLLNLCYYLQNGYCLYDDVHGEKIPGLEKFKNLYDPDNLLPLSFIERYSLTEATAELVISCYTGALMLQAMGLGG